jgi:putative aldouronate transport system permease protein
MLAPTAMILLILDCGSILNVGFEKVYLLQTPLNLAQSEVISTLVYKVGLKAQIPLYSYSTAVGLFTSVISLILITSVNKLSQRFSGTGVW